MLVIVVLTKFTKGAYLVLIAMPILYAMMRGDQPALLAGRRPNSRPRRTGLMLPGRNHVVVLVSKVHRPTMRALAFARATRPDTLTALTVNIDDDETRALLADWERHDLPIQLTVLDSPYREVTSPIINYVRQLRRDRPNDVVNVFIPEYVVGHWWEQLLHNQSALRLKGRLLFQPGVMVTSVPWQMDSSRLRAESVAEAAARSGRRSNRRPMRSGDGRRDRRADRAERADAPAEPPARCWPTAIDRAPATADRSRARCSGRCSSSTSAPVAHGGHCVARVGDDPAAGSSSSGTRCPGERVRALVTEDAGGVVLPGPTRSRCCAHPPDRVDAAVPARRARADAAAATGSTSTRRPSARSRRRSCASSSPGWPASTVDVEVAELPGGPLHWRTRIGYAVDAAGRPGLLRHRSHEVELHRRRARSACAGVGDARCWRGRWPGEARIEVVRDDDGPVSVLAAARPAPRPAPGRSPTRPAVAAPAGRGPAGRGSGGTRHCIDGAAVPIDFEVAPGGFWQVHPGRGADVRRRGAARARSAAG